MLNRRATFFLSTIALFAAFVASVVPGARLTTTSYSTAAALNKGPSSVAPAGSAGGSTAGRVIVPRQMIEIAIGRPSLDVCLVYRARARVTAKTVATVDKLASRPAGSAAVVAQPVTDVSHGPRGGGRVALTFDVESSVALPQILGALKNAGVKATFFMLGSWASVNPELAKRIADEGHEIANHSYNHPRFIKISDEAVAEELISTDRMLSSITQRPPSRLFRPPYGFADARVRGIAASNGFKTIFWSNDPNDWQIGQTVDSISNAVTKDPADGDIVVLHTSSAATGEALPAILASLSEAGTRQVTVSSLLGWE